MEINSAVSISRKTRKWGAHHLRALKKSFIKKKKEQIALVICSFSFILKKALEKLFRC